MGEKRITEKEKFNEKDPYNYTIKVLCNRWKPFILQAIKTDGVTRYSRFRKQLPISEKVLAQNLKELEADELIYKKVYPEVPPRVEYFLTEQGHSACEVLNVLYDWGWHEMKRRGLEIDMIGEMWHGYRERDEELLDGPYKEYNYRKKHKYDNE
ncbi:MAG: helix-turn-helix transcriptional regulator [Eubacterium sp.]|nr:helix-turn-helix transcriptional regulator [Eubacterium sp.]